MADANQRAIGPCWLSRFFLGAMICARATTACNRLWATRFFPPMPGLPMSILPLMQDNTHRNFGIRRHAIAHQVSYCEAGTAVPRGTYRLKK